LPTLGAKEARVLATYLKKKKGAMCVISQEKKIKHNIDNIRGGGERGEGAGNKGRTKKGEIFRSEK